MRKNKHTKGDMTMKMLYQSKNLGNSKATVEDIAFLNKAMIFNWHNGNGEERAAQTSRIVNVQKVNKNTITLTTFSGSTYTLLDVDSDKVERLIDESAHALRCLK